MHVCLLMSATTCLPEKEIRALFLSEENVYMQMNTNYFVFFLENGIWEKSNT